MYDPFVGTGSILVPAAHLGAHTLGTGGAACRGVSGCLNRISILILHAGTVDIDMRVIKVGKRDGRGHKVNVWTNFSDQGLEVGLAGCSCCWRVAVGVRTAMF